MDPNTPGRATRPRLAWVAGDAGFEAAGLFARALAASLADRYDLTSVAASARPDGEPTPGALTLAAARALDEAEPFDLWVYHLGDAPEYGAAREQAARRPGAALAHDASWGGDGPPPALALGAFDHAAWATASPAGPVALLPRGVDAIPARPSAHAKLDADLPLDRLVLATDASGHSGDAAACLLRDALSFLNPSERLGVLAVALGGTTADAQRRQNWGVGLAARPASPGAMARLAAGADVLASPPGGRSGEAALRALACGGVAADAEAGGLADLVRRLLREPGRRRSPEAVTPPIAASARAVAALLDAALARRPRREAVAPPAPVRPAHTIPATPPAAPPRLWAFVPHLIDGHRGQFNGIVRVVVSVLRGWLAAGVPNLGFCRLARDADGRLYVSEVPAAAVREHLRDDPAAPLALPPGVGNGPVSFRPGDVLFAPEVNPMPELGGVFRRLRASGVRLVPLIYDLIACRCPQYFGPAGFPAFWGWARELVAAADLVVADSHFTKGDVAWFADAVGVPAPPVEVCRLGDGDLGAVPTGHLDGVRGIRAGDAFALCCCTVEVRKNHWALYEVWRRLVARLGPGAVPPVVLVGKIGWSVDDLVSQMRADPLTRDHFLFLSDVRDDELAWLYRGAAFTLYPSLYEGWGLPVAEALACGKVVVASDASSIPEIGGPLVDYHAPLDLDALEARVLAALDPAYRAAREAVIRANYRPTAWADTAEQVYGFLERRFGLGRARPAVRRAG